MPTTLIVGAGVFGASTAYHLSRTSPPDASNRIILLDRAPFPDDPATSPPAASPGASWDWNKIIRADYDDVDYTRIMVNGLRAWATDPIFQPWYHHTGIVWWFPEAKIDKIIENYGDRLPEGAHRMSGPEGQKEGWFPHAKLEEGQGCMINPQGGWAMAKEALAATVRAAVALGVEYVSREAVRARRDESGKCVGVELDDGSVLEADRVVVCMGVGAIRFLEASGPDLAVGGKYRSGGFLTACIKSGLDNEVYNKVSAIELGNGEGGGFMPAGSRSPAKLYWDLPMLRNARLLSSGNVVSVPPPGPEHGMWDMPEKMRAQLRRVAALFFGDEIAASIEFENYRVCWDLSTADENFVISRVADVEGLYMATVGGFHGFKFLPVIGNFVVAMLNGTLDEKLAKKWDWARDRGDGWRTFADYEESAGIVAQEP